MAASFVIKFPQVEADDADEGVNSEVEYRMYEANSSEALKLFSVDSLTGEVTITQNLQGRGTYHTCKHAHLGHPVLEIMVELTIALDISKAFDGVWHKALFSILPSYSF